MTDKLNQSYDMNMKARGCIEKFKVYLNKDEHELEYETFLQQMWKWVKMALNFCKCCGMYWQMNQNYQMYVKTEDSGGNLIEKFVVVNLAILDVLVDMVNFSNFLNLVDKVGSVQELFNFK